LLSGTLPDLNPLQRLEHFSISRRHKSGRKLTGTLPILDQLSSLVTLRLGGNALTGSVPLGFVNASIKLELVDLRSNSLTGTVPSNLGHLPDLTFLVSDNAITDIADELCDDCDQLLCPPGTFNPLGRAIGNTSVCESCLDETSNASTTHLFDFATIPPQEIVEESYLFFGQQSCHLPVNERQVLTDLYQHTSGSLWTRNDFWLARTDHCDWYGVACDEDGRVVMIALVDNGLQGSLPASVWQLPALQMLWLGENPNLFVEFDGISYAASTLLELRLPQVQLTSLEGIDAATALVVLDVSSNNLEFMESVAPLPNLRILDVANNTLTNLPLLSATLLRSLRMSRNALTTLPNLDAFVSLQHLDLSFNEMTGSIPTHYLSHLPYQMPLTLDWSHNRLSGRVPSTWSRFDQITWDLTDNAITKVPWQVCDNNNYNDCDALLCPAGTASPTGQAPCTPCMAGEWMGQTSCPEVLVFSGSATTTTTVGNVVGWWWGMMIMMIVIVG